MKKSVFYHLPGIFEFYDFYQAFLPLFHEHREFFYEWCDIGSIYGAPAECIWGGGRIGFGDADPVAVKDLMDRYHIPVRLTFSNSLLKPEHLTDSTGNKLCKIFADQQNGIIIYSDLLMNYIHRNYPEYYFISSTTKVITEFDGFQRELHRPEFRYVVPDFRLNPRLSDLAQLTQEEKDKTEFLANECCWFDCPDRKACYEAVSRLALGISGPAHVCHAPHAHEGYVFSRAMENPGFLSLQAIQETYVPMGFSQFKIEGRSLGSALLLEFILYYMTKPECQLKMREAMYLGNELDLF